MGTLTGTRLDGTAFSKRVNARTRRLMIRDPLVELDCAALVDAPDLEVFEVTSHEVAARLRGFEAIGDHGSLESVALRISGGLDLTPLRSCGALRSLDLYVHGTDPFDLAALVGTKIERLSLSGNDQTALDLSPLAEIPTLTSLHIHGGEWRELDLSPLAGLPLEHFGVDVGYVKELVLGPVAAPSLRTLSLLDLELEHLDLSPFAACRGLQSVMAGNNDLISLDLGALGGVASLTRFGWPDVKHIHLDEAVPIVAPALAHLSG